MSENDNNAVTAQEGSPRRNLFRRLGSSRRTRSNRSINDNSDGESVASRSSASSQLSRRSVSESSLKQNQKKGGLLKRLSSRRKERRGNKQASSPSQQSPKSPVSQAADEQDLDSFFDKAQQHPNTPSGTLTDEGSIVSESDAQKQMPYSINGGVSSPQRSTNTFQSPEGLSSVDEEDKKNCRPDQSLLAGSSPRSVLTPIVPVSPLEDSPIAEDGEEEEEPETGIDKDAAKSPDTDLTPPSLSLKMPNEEATEGKYKDVTPMSLMSTEPPTEDEEEAPVEDDIWSHKSPRGQEEIEIEFHRDTSEPCEQTTPSFTNGSVHRFSLYQPGDVDKILAIEGEEAARAASFVEGEKGGQNMYGTKLPNRHYFYYQDYGGHPLSNGSQKVRSIETVAESPSAGNEQNCVAPDDVNVHSMRTSEEDEQHENHANDLEYLRSKMNLFDKHHKHDDVSDVFLEEKLKLFDMIHSGDDRPPDCLEAQSYEDHHSEACFVWMTKDYETMLSTLPSKSKEDDVENNDRDENELEEKLNLFDQLHKHDDESDLFLERKLDLFEKHGGEIVVRRDLEVQAEEDAEREREMKLAEEEAARQQLLRDVVGIFVL